MNYKTNILIAGLCSAFFLSSYMGCISDSAINLFHGNNLFRMYFPYNESFYNVKRINVSDKQLEIKIVGKYLSFASNDGTVYRVEIILSCNYKSIGIVPEFDINSISARHDDIDLNYNSFSIWHHNKNEKVISYYIELSSDSSSNYLEYAYIDCDKPLLHFNLSGILLINGVPIEISPFIAYPCKPSFFEG